MREFIHPHLQEELSFTRVEQGVSRTTLTERGRQKLQEMRLHLQQWYETTGQTDGEQRRLERSYHLARWAGVPFAERVGVLARSNEMIWDQDPLIYLTLAESITEEAAQGSG